MRRIRGGQGLSTSDAPVGTRMPAASPMFARVRYAAAPDRMSASGERSAGRGRPILPPPADMTRARPGSPFGAARLAEAQLGAVRALPNFVQPCPETCYSLAPILPLFLKTALQPGKRCRRLYSHGIVSWDGSFRAVIHSSFALPILGWHIIRKRNGPVL